MKPDFVDIRRSIMKLYPAKKMSDFDRKNIIRKLKATGELEQYFEKEEIDKKLEKLLRSYVDTMKSKKIKLYKYFRKYCLSSFQFFPKLYSLFSFELGAYLTEGTEITEEDEKLFKSFPHFFKKICEKYNIEPYASMDVEKLRLYLSDYVDMIDHNMVMPAPPSHNRSDVTEQLIEHVYNSIDNSKKWNATKYGDGYGFCIVHLDKRNKKEVLITVKASRAGEDFSLNRIEYKVMRDAASLPNTEYLVIKYDCAYSKNRARVNSHQVYKYDKEKNVLVDVKDSSNICKLEGYFVYDREEREAKIPRVRFRCKKLVLTPTDNNDNNK